MVATVILKALFTITKNKQKLKFQQENGYITIYLLCLYAHSIPKQNIVQPLNTCFIIISNDFSNVVVMLNKCSDL